MVHFVVVFEISMRAKLRATFCIDYDLLSFWLLMNKKPSCRLDSRPNCLTADYVVINHSR